MQIIEKNGKPFKIIADKEMKLTKNREFFVDVVYLGVNDKVENYEEVPYEIWCNFLPDLVPKTKVQELEQRLSTLQQEKDYLETILLNTDFRLTCMELKDQGLLD